MSTLTERRLAGVAWRDLVSMTAWECAVELTLPLPWLAASIFCYDRGWIALGAFCSVYLFLTGLRLAHGLQHYHLPVSHRAQDAVMSVLSLIMLGSIHAIQATHLNHHRHCLKEADVEGRVAKWPAWKALLWGPIFPVATHRAALKLASRAKRRWIVSEIAAIAIIVGLSPWMPAALAWFVLSMVVAECMTGFFAVWTVHRDCDEGIPFRTQRGVWSNRLFYNMFYHAEHHLFPAVPTCHQAELARRLDAVAGEYRGRLVFPGRDPLGARRTS